MFSILDEPIYHVYSVESYNNAGAYRIHHACCYILLFFPHILLTEKYFTLGSGDYKMRHNRVEIFLVQSISEDIFALPKEHMKNAAVNYKNERKGALDTRI
jgi:hypothetical protein